MAAWQSERGLQRTSGAGKAMTSSTPDDILVPVSVGELIDKITILEIKSDRIANPVQAANVRRELAALQAVRRQTDDSNGAARNRRGAEKIAGGGGIGFDGLA